MDGERHGLQSLEWITSYPVWVGNPDDFHSRYDYFTRDTDKYNSYVSTLLFFTDFSMKLSFLKRYCFFKY